MRTIIIATLLLLTTLALARDISATAIVDRYVQDHKHWKRSDYRIRRDHIEGHFVVFLVTYLPDQKRVTVGGGETFEAYYHPAKYKVAKEIHFQEHMAISSQPANQAMQPTASPRTASLSHD